MLLYSFAMLLGLVLSSPWWLLRMATTHRYREGLWQRLGRVPEQLRVAVHGRRVVWIHAVSVGEVLAASRLVAELETSLGSGWIVVISTTTRTGQALARERFGAGRVFYMPLDFAFAVRAYLRALKPAALVLMENEVWPRMLHECRAAGVPVAVVNARVSDRSFARGVKLRRVWSRVLRGVTLWLAQSEEDAQRLAAIGVAPERIQVSGNLKYDVRAGLDSVMAPRLKRMLFKSRILIAGSTLPGEEEMVLEAWRKVLPSCPDIALLLAPRHPDRFAEVKNLLRREKVGWYPCSALMLDTEPIFGGVVLLLDTIGDLASVYGIADAAFVGGSLVDRGGHNPLEPAQFGVPVVMGPHFQNFRTVVHAMESAQGIRIVADNESLGTALVELLSDPAAAKAMGERGRRVFEEQQGATARTVAALAAMIRGERK